ncbi:MAG: porin family protein [Candidatus Symbiothrix sp.]|jgi:hypothetical protein|nr:porin family protein [Candidatus Symbiothrix sp.]
MRKVILSIIVAFLGIVSANAQFYAGGSFGYNSSTTKGDKNTTSSFSIAPMVGYRLNDKLDFGLSISANSYKSTSRVEGYDALYYAVKYKTQDFSVAPYLRYSMIKFGKFNILGSAGIFAGKGKMKQEILVVSEEKYTNWGASIYPTVIYDLSDKFAVFSNLNFFRLGFSQTKIEDGYTTTDFDFILNATDILPAIGVMYKF